MTKTAKSKSVRKVPSKSATVSKASRTVARSKKLKQPAERTAVQEALQVTWLLKGTLKNAQLSYIRVGKLLVQVRDKNLYSALGHANMEAYAEQRLQLGRSSLYKYIQVYDWISTFHPAWSQPKPKGFIPDLSDAADLMWIDNELTRTDLEPAKKTALVALQEKALEGKLKQSELAPYRTRKRANQDSLKSFLSKLRNLRKCGAEQKNMPPEVISHLDAAITVLKNENSMSKVDIS